MSKLGTVRARAPPGSPIHPPQSDESGIPLVKEGTSMQNTTHTEESEAEVMALLEADEMEAHERFEMLKKNGAIVVAAVAAAVNDPFLDHSWIDIGDLIVIPDPRRTVRLVIEMEVDYLGLIESLGEGWHPKTAEGAGGEAMNAICPICRTWVFGGDDERDEEGNLVRQLECGHEIPVEEFDPDEFPDYEGR